MSSESTDLPAQRFLVSHLNESDFKSGGLRSYSAYRDLGIAAATRGFATGHVIRMTAPFTEERRQKHHHNVLGWSDDCELLEIILPAVHETANDE